MSQPSARLLPVGTTMLLAALLFASLRQGAYHQWQHQTFAWLVLGAALFLLGQHAGRQALSVSAVVISPVLLSALLSTWLSSDRSDARSTLLEILLIGVGLAAGAATPLRHHDTVVKAVLLIATVVSATAIYGVATHTTPWGRITAGLWRGSSSLTYANAAAGVIGPSALLAFSHAARTRGRLYAVVSCGLTVGLVATQSRAGVVATGVVGLWLLSSTGMKRSVEAAIPILAGLALALPLLLVFAANDRGAQPVAVMVAIVLGLAATALLWPMRARVRRPQLMLGVIVLFAVGIVALSGATSLLAERLTLRSGTTAQGEDAAVLFGDRANEWSTAWNQFADKPVVGHGPGLVDLRWVEDGRSFRAIFVHNEYLELAVTQGAVGLAALVASVLLFRRFRRVPTAGLPVLFAVGAYLLHSGFDYLWHLPALPVLFALLAGTTLDIERPVVRSRPVGQPEKPRRSKRAQRRRYTNAAMPSPSN